MIEAQALTIGNRHQKEINQDFLGGEIMDKSVGDKPMIDPTERASYLPDPFMLDEPLDIHKRHLLVV